MITDHCVWVCSNLELVKREVPSSSWDFSLWWSCWKTRRSWRRHQCQQLPCMCWSTWLCAHCLVSCLIPNVHTKGNIQHNSTYHHPKSLHMQMQQFHCIKSLCTCKQWCHGIWFWEGMCTSFTSMRMELSMLVSLKDVSIMPLLASIIPEKLSRFSSSS